VGWACQDNLQQSQTKQQELLLPPVDFKREISDAVEADVFNQPLKL
jgi:hypothetical protein